MEFEKPIRPHGDILEALGGKISDPIETISNKPGEFGKQVSVRIATEGPGMIGLTDAEDNESWFGILNHCLLSARYGVYFSRLMQKAGYITSPDRILNATIVSHTGRRQWEEALWYPDAIDDSQSKRSISNETLGMGLIESRVPRDIFDLVAALGYLSYGTYLSDPSTFDSWDYKIAVYVDHRTTQEYQTLNRRLGDFLITNFYQKETVTDELRARVYQTMASIINRQKSFRLGVVGTEEISLEEADRLFEDLGANSDSLRLKRLDLMRLVLQDAETEAALIRAGINPDIISDQIVPAKRWERYLKRLYINDAEEEILNLYKGREVLANSPWGRYVKQLIEQGRMPYRSERGKLKGTKRAIEFFGRLDYKTSQANTS